MKNELYSKMKLCDKMKKKIEMSIFCRHHHHNHHHNRNHRRNHHRHRTLSKRYGSSKSNFLNIIKYNEHFAHMRYIRYIQANHISNSASTDCMHKWLCIVVCMHIYLYIGKYI